MKTRAQEDSQLAYQQISALPAAAHTAYGRLCHHFPMLVLRSGLCQAVAFYTVKASAKANEKASGSAHQEAYRNFLQHMAVAAGIGEIGAEMGHEAFQQRIHTMDLSAYRQTTRRVLAAAIWYKRFAISCLNVEAGGGEV